MSHILKFLSILVVAESVFSLIVFNSFSYFAFVLAYIFSCFSVKISKKKVSFEKYFSIANCLSEHEERKKNLVGDISIHVRSCVVNDFFFLSKLLLRTKRVWEKKNGFWLDESSVKVNDETSTSDNFDIINCAGITYCSGLRRKERASKKQICSFLIFLLFSNLCVFFFCFIFFFLSSSSCAHFHVQQQNDVFADRRDDAVGIVPPVPQLPTGPITNDTVDCVNVR